MGIHVRTISGEAEASLRRLQLDVIDLYQIHWPLPEEDIEEAWGEIAGLRGTSEATVRHQARAVYQKSSLPGRTAFCAYFLEDLLAPQATPLSHPNYVIPPDA